MQEQTTMARTVNAELVKDYADQLRPLLPLAGRAYGTQRPDSAPRKASDQVNEIILDYVDHHGNMTHLANELEGSISLPGLRRRLRSARGGSLGPSNRKRGSKEPEKVKAAAFKIAEARSVSSVSYAAAVRQAYADGISLREIGKVLGISYYSLWSAASHNN